MKRKMIAVLFLVVACLGMLVVEGVSQPPSPPAPGIQSFTRSPPPVNQTMPSPTARPIANFSAVEPRQQEWTFEQLVEALNGVRARQKELQVQEADLLAKIEEKIVEKRKDLSKAEKVLQKLRGEPSVRYAETPDPRVPDPILKKREPMADEKKSMEKK